MQYPPSLLLEAPFAPSACSLCLVVQLTLAATAWPFNRSICAAVPLATAAARGRNERIFVVLSTLRFLLPLSTGASGSLPASADERLRGCGRLPAGKQGWAARVRCQMYEAVRWCVGIAGSAPLACKTR